MVTLRPYQQNAVDSIIKDINVPGNSVACLATGSGKSLIIAEVSRLINKPILIFQPSLEILQQNYEKLLQHVPKEDIGIYSASAGEKTIKKFTFATIGSCYKTPELFKGFGIVLIDENHLVNVTSFGTMFMSFLDAIGVKKVIGLTATPFRLSNTYIPDGFGNLEQVTTIKIITRMRGKRETCFWSRILCNVTTDELIKMGYLCKLHYYDNTKIQHSEIPLNKSASDFNLEEYEKLITSDEDRILDAVIRVQSVSKNVLVFCCSVDQATRFSKVVIGSAVVSALTPKKERARIIDEFKTGTIKTVFNVSCLTVGFDHPSLDAIVNIRPTKSLALYSQMIGRGLRIADGKEECKVIDFSGTFKSIGPVESIKLVKRRMWELESSKKSNWHGVCLYKITI